MPSHNARRRVVTLWTGLAFVATLVVAGLLPNTGAFTVSAACPYSNCSTTNNSSVPLYLYGVLAALVLAAIILGVVLMRRRRPSSTTAPVSEWEGGAAGPAAVGAPSGPEGPVEGAAGAGVAGSAYLEGPEDVGAPPPEVPGPPPGAAGGESDIDSLMQELDKISGEILKRGPPKKPSGDEATEDAEAGDGGGD